MKKKTIFIAVNQGFAVRYLLQTDIFADLQKNCNKIILLVPDPDNILFAPYKEYDNVIIERYQMNKYEKYHKRHKFEKLLIQVRLFILNSKYNIQTIDDYYKKVYLKHMKNTFSEGFGIVRKIIQHFIITIGRRCKFIRRMILLIEHAFFVPLFHSDLYKIYNPNMLIVPSLGTFQYDQFLIREARKFNAKVVSVILSWDNTTTRGMPGAIPDHVVAWSDVMKDELIKLNDIPEKKIFVGGIAHWDHYYRDETFLSKNDLLEKMGLDKNKKVLFFGTKSPNGYAYNADIAQILLKAIRDKQFVKPCQLVVRLHPIYYRIRNGKNRFQYFLDQFESLKKMYPEIIINKPVILEDSVLYSMPKDEINTLASLLKYSDIVINLFSTLNLEATIFDKPIVNVCFEGDSYTGPPRARYNIFIDERQTHNQRVIVDKGLKIAYNQQELIDYINEYLRNPNLDREGRKKIKTRETGTNPGNAGRKIAEYIYSL